MINPQADAIRDLTGLHVLIISEISCEVSSRKVSRWHCKDLLKRPEFLKGNLGCFSKSYLNGYRFRTASSALDLCCRLTQSKEDEN